MNNKTINDKMNNADMCSNELVGESWYAGKKLSKYQAINNDIWCVVILLVWHGTQWNGD